MVLDDLQEADRMYEELPTPQKTFVATNNTRQESGMVEGVYQELEGAGSTADIYQEIGADKVYEELPSTVQKRCSSASADPMYDPTYQDPTELSSAERRLSPSVSVSAEWSCYHSLSEIITQQQPASSAAEAERHSLALHKEPFKEESSASKPT